MKAIERALEKWTETRVGSWTSVLRVADQEALAAGHTRIGSEHLLLALVVGGAGSAARYLREHGIDVHALRHRITTTVDERGGDPQALGPADLHAAGLEELAEEPFEDAIGRSTATRRAGFRRLHRTHRWTPEALAVLDTATEHAHNRNRGQPRRQRDLTDDDLAIALATTRGTRAWDLLHEFELPREAMAAAAGSDQATAAD